MFLRPRTATRPRRRVPNQDRNPFSLEQFANDEINIQDSQSLAMNGGVRHTPPAQYHPKKLAPGQNAKGNIFKFLFSIFAVAATIGSIWETALLVCRLSQASCSLQAHIGMAPGFNVTYLCEIARGLHNLPPASAQDMTPKAHNQRLKAVEDDIASIIQIMPEPPLARRNFALHVGGAKVIPELTSPTHLLPAHTLKTRFLQWFRGHDFFHDHVNLPIVVLEADVGVGQCWEFLGSRGSIGLLLPDDVDIKEFSINHVSPPLISTQSAARSPRIMTLWGLLSADHNLVEEFETRALSTIIQSKNPSQISKRNDRFLRLADAHYNMTAPSLLQFFPLSPTVEKLNLTFSTLILDVTGNWGANTTCLYSLGIYGDNNTHQL